MLRKIFPNWLMASIHSLNDSLLYELRLRVARPMRVTYDGKKLYLGAEGVCACTADAFVCTRELLEDVVIRASDYSLYNASTQLAQSFLTVAGGIRIGVCGEPICANQSASTVKDISSLVVRVPHEVVGCSSNVCCDGSILVTSLPGRGKTTMLRDIARRISLQGKNVVIVDERCEIAASVKGVPTLDVGECDVVSNCSKIYGITHAIRAMSPDVIVTDEISDDIDITAVRRCVGCGIDVVASIHASEDVGSNPSFSTKFYDAFTRIVTLSDVGVGKISSIRELR